MIEKDFLESYPLYTKYSVVLPEIIDEIVMLPVNIYCKKCDSFQTFVLAEKRNAFGEIIYDLPKGIAESPGPNTIYIRSKEYLTDDAVLNATYCCVGCGETLQHYSIKINGDQDYILKIGQYPPLDISINKELKKVLGEYEETYKKGLICENQGYGIGAYAYYRRIVEEIIESLLEKLIELVGDNKGEYLTSLNNAKESKNATDKIAKVKDVLPESLNMESNNPLKALHSTLSKGIHSLSDEECLEVANSIREILEILIRNINEQIDEKKVLDKHLKKTG